jgi:hypothetical protein
MGNALDVAIGVIFVYLLLALIVTTLQELFASLFSWRAKNLYAALEGMLKEDGKASDASDSLRARLYRHPLLKNLVKEELPAHGKASWDGKGLPSYIPSKTFALALLDVLQGDHTVSDVSGTNAILAAARDIVSHAPVGEYQRSLLTLLDTADGATKDLDQRASVASERIETWFNDRMARASGWYKRSAQAWSLIAAILVSVLCNADTLQITTELWKNASLRESVVAAAEAFQKTNVAPSAPSAPDPDKVHALATSVVKQSNDLIGQGLPLGWSEADDPQTWPLDKKVVKLLGWLITALAVSLGAGFWFDVLSKALQLRGSGAKVSAATGVIEQRPGKGGGAP